MVPVAIEYSKKKDFWTSGGMGTQIMRQTGKWRTRAKLRIGDPIYGDDAVMLMQETKAWIDKNLIEMQDGWSEMFPN